MTEALCVAEDCRGGHLSDCDEDKCRGCGPDRAADGKWLCRWHCARLTEWPMEAAEVYADLALMLNRTGVMAERVSATPDRGLSVNEAAVKARTVIRHTFVGWVRIIHEERGFSLPGRHEPERLPEGFIGPPRLVWAVTDTVPAMARYLVRNADWLASHGAAGDYAEEMRELARGEARRVAHPSGTRKFQVRTPEGDPVQCTKATEDGPCPGYLWTILRNVDSLLPSMLACDHDEEHGIPANQWYKMGRRLMAAAETPHGDCRCACHTNPAYPPPCDADPAGCGTIGCDGRGRILKESA